MKIIETNRLALRELNTEDVSSLFQILSDKETMSYYPSTYDMTGVRRWIKKSIKSYTENSFGLWAVLLKENCEFIGQCGISLQNINGKIIPEIGYHISKKFWNRGYATESAKASLEYGFKNLKLNEIFIHTYVKNIPSQRVAEKIGMKKLYIYEKLLMPHNIKWDHVVYSKKR
ncbi:GNAT family N-acetyltransferase [Hanstruepera flava]|uniref:GNAT family N-acetyltransferase n=1 Tax=Hanstruepera flava TaxID=2930218 RepID=UPI0020292B51|nr:GNAT family N-acetyltransferase [Hanstruepera flava]